MEEPTEDEEELAAEALISEEDTELVDFPPPENLFRREELAAKRLFSRLLLLNKSLSLLELGDLEPLLGCSGLLSFSSDEDEAS